MAEKPLIETNPYLRDRGQAKRMLLINVGSSAAIELGSFPAEISQELKTLHLQELKLKKSPRFFGELH